MDNNLILRTIQVLLVVTIIFVTGYIIQHTRRHKINMFERFGTGFWIGLVTDCLDAIGIGSFATTTTFFKMTKLVDDDSKIPGTMNAVHLIPTLVQALCFILAVKVDMTTLLSMAVASIFGAIAGTRITRNWKTSTVQLVLGTLLIIASCFTVYRLLTNPGEGLTDNVTGLTGIWLIIGIIFNFLCGALMTIGLGNYAPELIFFSMLGINPTVAMPVMMLNAAVVMTTSTIPFIKADRVNWTGFAGMVIGGVIGVIIAVLFLTNIPITVLKWLVVFVVIYTGISMIKASRQAKA
ncbi:MULTISPECIES: sulfite exporter TauE/SafE family protein [unclassified Streptococcus]|uniref:sulfite exporter TauE/SafE family protein n=1 Tax=unclassified Streptococcus TaxID=2608887 RepID=UPI0011B6B46D|nr:MULTISPECIES: sulfite exporter TauE/SafE family protein [unclassified Streptococcus]TWT11205.1 sulfite exporter TauE/SafE family protein [Streptococcus sp. sy004]TWT16188.1 sulfite exporter TauE/SafE family protein [Streptococcus sp. sy010]